MKIAFVISTFPPQVGGMGQVAFEEARRLFLLGHQVTIFTLNHKGFDFSVEKNLPFKIVRLNGFLFGDAGLAFGLFSKLKKFDLVHLHYPFYGSAHYVVLAKLVYGQKYVLTYHMDARPQGFLKKSLQLVYDILFAKLIFKNAEKIITVDQDHLKSSDFYRILEKDKIYEVPNAVDTEMFKPGKISNIDFLKKTANKKVALFVGNPLPFKRLDFILKSWSLLDNKSGILIVASDGYEIEKYKKMAFDLNISDSVSFVGRQKDQKDLVDFYRRADCLIVASKGSAESFSLVAAEAASTGAVVVVSNSAGIKNRVVDKVSGFVFEADSPQSLSDKINEAFNLSDGQKNDFSKKARLSILEKFSWNNHMDLLLKIYQSL